MNSTNLLDALAWVPVIDGDGVFGHRTLDSALAEADTIRCLACPEPMQQAALLRLLVAACHRDRHGDGRIDIAAARDRLHDYRDRFDLDGPAPFAQTRFADIDDGQTAPGPVTALLPYRAGGDDHLWYDSRPDAQPPLGAAEAARALIALQTAGPGGLQRGPHPKGSKPADRAGSKGPLCGPVGIFIIGPTLAATIAANLPPGEIDPDDRPCWERDAVTVHQRRAPTGPVDWLTWTPKAVQLSWNAAGEVDGVTVRPGLDHPDGVDTAALDPHLGHRPDNDGPIGANWAHPGRLATLLDGDNHTTEARGALAAWAQARPGQAVKIAVFGRRTDKAKILADRIWQLDLTAPAEASGDQTAPPAADTDQVQPALF